MTELLTAAQMRAIEKAAIDSGEVTGLELMERAGRGVVEVIFEEWPELAKADGGAAPEPPEYLVEEETCERRAVVLCGPGNNGGDGFVVARLLKEWGWDVEVFLYGDAEKLPPDARVNFERWGEMATVADILSTREIRLLGGHKRKTRRWSQPTLQIWADAVVIDAVFGIGLDRPIDGQLREVIRDIELISGARKRVAIDVPSGLHSDTGVFVDFASCELKEMREAIEFVPIEADLTVTFHRRKRSQMMRDGAKFCGKITVVDIGL
jgi:hydroxyethylthiazole kinase-like uncharacterized protein yjeF